MYMKVPFPLRTPTWSKMERNWEWQGDGRGRVKTQKSMLRH